MNEEAEETEEIKVSLEELSEIANTSLDTWDPNTMRYYGPSTRTLLLSGEITEERANALISQIQELNFLDDEAPISLYINTVGGSIIDALAIYDMLLCVSNPIVTIVNGGCYSAGLIIATAGDHRLATPNSIYFYHQPNLQLTNIDSRAVMDSNREFYDWCKDNTDRIMRERINMSEQEWDEKLGDLPSKYFNVQEAIELGFATDTLEHMEKPTLHLTEDSC